LGFGDGWNQRPTGHSPNGGWSVGKGEERQGCGNYHAIEQHGKDSKTGENKKERKKRKEFEGGDQEK
jgi:hypothetical protein